MTKNISWTISFAGCTWTPDFELHGVSIKELRHELNIICSFKLFSVFIWLVFLDFCWLVCLLFTCWVLACTLVFVCLAIGNLVVVLMLVYLGFHGINIWYACTYELDMGCTKYGCAWHTSMHGIVLYDIVACMTLHTTRAIVYMSWVEFFMTPSM
jgi:hypothetical protein